MNFEKTKALKCDDFAYLVPRSSAKDQTVTAGRAVYTLMYVNRYVTVHVQLPWRGTQ